MNYWHLQMHLPEGRDGKTVIDSLEMLREPRPIIGTGEWDDIQCRYFKGEQGGLEIGSIVMVRRGNEPLALVKVVSKFFTSEELEEKYINHLYRYVEILDWNNQGMTSSLFSQGTLKVLYENADTASWNYINEWYQKSIKMADLKKVIELLKFKKQIILQGPPGTGKTLLAKKIAREILVPHVITESDIRNNLSVGLKIKSATGYTDYTINAIGKVNITVGLKDAPSEYKPTYKEIIEAFSIKMWEGKQVKGNDSYSSAIAKYLYENSNSKQFKIIQFHPSYSYEDFVRGIVAESKGDRIEYKNVNKVLGKFAQDATKSWIDSTKDGINISRENKIREYFEQFLDDLEAKIAGGSMINLTPSVNLIEIEDDAFRYKGNAGWNALGNRMLFKDIIQAFIDGNQVRQDIRKNKNLSGLAIQHATYFVRVLNMFQEYLVTNSLNFDHLITENPELKNYVLIIDEINRANLSSVLGELIYALEYRDHKVESMYEVDGNNELVLPSNLYIIGTMNTADRSVGHIDYAIRRRFAFVDVMSKDLTDELGDKFHKDLFDKVATMFSANLSPEFEKKDVQLGHSYFIDKSDEGGSMAVRLKYEIRPILMEYFKDGILIGEDIKNQIENLHA